MGVCKAVLEEHGYLHEHIKEAMEACGGDIQRAVAYCISRSSGAALPTENQAISPDEASRKLMMQMSFSTDDITRALEACDFDFPQALRLLLSGDDAGRIRYESQPVRFERHTAKTIVRQMAPPSQDATRQYELRALQFFESPHIACDLGMLAHSSINACFWLCFAAG